MGYTAAELNRLHAEAHREARILRAQALADFWRGADALVHDAAYGTYRSAQRLAYRIARRRPASPITAVCGRTTPAP
jgi:hypothetical protein